MAPKGVVVDICATLVSSNVAQMEAFAQACEELGHSISFQQVWPLIGIGSFPNDQFEEAIAIYDDPADLLAKDNESPLQQASEVDQYQVWVPATWVPAGIQSC